MFSADLVKRIDMVPYGKAQIIHFGSGGKAGYTLVQLIETSNITGHFVEEVNDAYLDVFSCKDYDEKEVEQCIKEYFKPLAIQTMRIKRQAELK
jgi:S-adenosylmethionine/arginine decarboxylase-like enzyme